MLRELPRFEQLEQRNPMAGDISGVFGDSALMIADDNMNHVGLRTYLSESLNGKIVFLTVDGSGDLELWRTNGTESGTSLVMEIAANQRIPPPLWYRWDSQVVGNEAFFAFNTISTDYDPEIPGGPWGELLLWKTDGTTSGTQLVSKISNWAIDHEGVDVLMTDFGNRLLFAVTQNDFSELWTSDGTSDGTVLCSSDFHTEFRDPIDDFVALRGNRYFLSAQDNVGGLWMTEPAAETVDLVTELPFSQRVEGTANQLVAGKNSLYFSVKDESGAGRSVWKSDGTESGTTPVIHFPHPPGGFVSCCGILPHEGGAYISSKDVSSDDWNVMWFDETLNRTVSTEMKFDGPPYFRSRWSVEINETVFFTVSLLEGEAQFWRFTRMASN